MKLPKFSNFVNLIYPHELKYLDTVEKFENEEIRRIIDRIRFNVYNPNKTKEFFGDIDKRKYSYLMKWIKEKLAIADVDVFFEWIIKLEKEINMDNVHPEDEKKLLNYTKTILPTSYFFMRFYEMLNAYRDYLLIRTRILYYESVQVYLQKYELDYLRAVDLNKKMNKSAVDIISHHIDSKGDSIQWEKFLLDTFSNKNIDGFTRYKAFIRITYIHYNYRKFEELRGIYNELDKQIQTTAFYSKRILANYYSNRAMMHSMLREMDQAEYFAYLSVRQKNSDYLFYLIKLCNILIIENKNKTALQLMTENIHELKTNNSMYTQIGFVSVYIRVLNKNGKYSKGESYGDTFLSSHKRDLFSFRWHIFFCAYFMSLLKQEKYKKLLSIEKRYKLVQKEKEFFGKARYVPTIQWYHSLSQYMEGKINEKQLQEIITISSKKTQNNKYLQMKILELRKDIFDFLPDVF
jgi:hypothetical protein